MNQSISFWQLWRDVSLFASNHGSVIFRLVLPFALLQMGLTALVVVLIPGNDALWLSILISLLITPLYTGPLIKYTAIAVMGHPSDDLSPQQLRVSLNEWRDLAVVSVLQTMAFVGGLMLLILPGLYLAARFAFADIQVIVERSDAFNSMQRSWQASAQTAWVLLAGVILLMLVNLVLAQWLASLMGEEPTHLWLWQMLGQAQRVVFTVIGLLFFLRVYSAVALRR